MSIIKLVGVLFMVVFPIMLVIGYLARGRVARWGLGNYTPYVVCALVLTMSVWAGGIVAAAYVVNILLYSMIYAVVSIMTSLLATLPITRFRGYAPSAGSSHYIANPNTKFPMILIAILITGWVVGYMTRVSLLVGNALDYAITIELLVLIIIIGLDVGSYLDKSRIVRGTRGVLIGVLSMVGSAIAGLVLHVILMIPLPASLGIALGMGWYSLDGPLLTVRFGPVLGTMGFLANFLREQLTYVLVPALFLAGFRNESLIAIGGATSMDNTLPIYRLYMGSDGGFMAFINGFFITMVLPLALPYIITL
ncbi:lysine exporter LysO family protein [Vulcanisaeta thermophila]|uniref:lysine exporter LysO family protein n=1 Tax=Vulcanisaeta thermophila TaxID=867917 RepID=UPI00085294D0|nr:lysine exporter LysO family protein [Vulcanisaeta thermophila]